MTFTVITASAGSGKTYRLTQVLSERLSTPGESGTPLQASEVIATTFTVRAAADLVEKTQQRLLDDGNISAAEEIRTALIGTIHSVCGRLVSEYAIDAGYSPQLRVLDEAEQKKAFHTAVDEVIASAEGEHRDLLIRTGHDGVATDESRFAASIAWAQIVNTVVEEARENQLGADELRASAEASVREFLSVLPAAGDDGRSQWLEQLKTDVDVLRWALRVYDGDSEPGAPVDIEGVRIDGRSRGNVEGSIISLEKFLRQFDESSGGGDHEGVRELSNGDRFARVPWKTWATVASAGYGAAEGGKKPGKVPLGVLIGSSAALVSRELLANSAFQQDVIDLIRLVFDTAIDSLAAYEEYKNDLGVMDFVDQEVRALDLLRSNARVRSSVASRYRLLAVDEFQDTSPIQLALFMELAQLVDDVIWVGDRKQAIYGFRGADPELMNDVFSSLIDGSSGLGTAQTENLGYSWRSSQAPLELSNTLFRSVFSDQPEDEVVLTIPPQREARRYEGGREVWVPDTDKGKDSRAGSRLTTTIADGIVDFLQRAPQLPVSSGEAGTGAGAASEAAPVTHRAVEPGDIAVLVRSNSEVARVVDGLLERGVPATGSAVALLQTREGQYVRAGLAAVVDSSDTVALAELVTLLPDHARRATWFEDAVRIVDRDERTAHPHTWWEDETLHALASLRGRISDVSPSQLLVEVIDALDLPQRIKGWSAPDTRLANLGGLRQLALEYEESALSTRTPVSAAGLLAHLMDVGDEYSDATAHDAVLVTTMHQSKGLQWPVVVTGIPQSRDWGHKVVSVQKAETFDVLKPLDGRSIRFLPRVLDGYDDLKERMDGSAVVSAGKVAERRESARLYYVGLTRAELYSIVAFAYPDGQGNALAEAIDTDLPLLEWDVPEPGTATGEIRVNDLRVGAAEGLGLAGTNLAVTMRMSAIGDEPRVLEREQAVSAYAYTDVPLRRPPAREDLFSARFTASSAPSEGIDADIRVVAQLGEPLIAKGGVDWDVVGDAVHAYLGIPHQALPPAMAREAAQRIVDRWVVGDVVGADVLVEAGARWAGWVEATYPGAEILTEQPIAWRNELHQLMEGWIDARVMLADGGHVLADHKSYPGVDPVGHVRDNYVGQLAAYASALEGTTGEWPREILVHLPLRGEVVGVELSPEAREIT